MTAWGLRMLVAWWDRWTVAESIIMTGGYNPSELYWPHHMPAYSCRSSATCKAVWTDEYNTNTSRQVAAPGVVWGGLALQKCRSAPPWNILVKNQEVNCAEFFKKYIVIVSAVKICRRLQMLQVPQTPYCSFAPGTHWGVSRPPGL